MEWVNGEKTEDVVALLDRLYNAKRTVEERIVVLGGKRDPVGVNYFVFLRAPLMPECHVGSEGWSRMEGDFEDFHESELWFRVIEDASCEVEASMLISKSQHLR